METKRIATIPHDYLQTSNEFIALWSELFGQSWQPLPRWLAPEAAGEHYDLPFSVLEPLIPESLLLCKRGNQEHLLSNVCSHRGHLVVTKTRSSTATSFACPYHGRRFGIAGTCQGQPHTSDPQVCRPQDDLPQRPLTAAFGLDWFTITEPNYAITAEQDHWHPYLGFLQTRQLLPQPQTFMDYEVAAPWSLYVENYLEGLHIPFVHPSLLRTMNFSEYQTLTHGHSSLQIAFGSQTDCSFALPQTHPLRDRHPTAFYLFLFPNIMLNYYPWGLSLNVVQPLAANRTRVRFRSFAAPGQEHLMQQGSGSGLDQVEHEDEEVVLAVAQGIHSRLYRGGTLDPKWEAGVIQFQQLLKPFLGHRR